jgi:hypothetical protein
MVGKADVQVVDAICQAFSRKSVSAWVCLCAEQFAVYGMERNLQECLFGRIVIKKKGISRIGINIMPFCQHNQNLAPMNSL